MAENLSISEKLSDIQTTKTAIREAIVAKGVDMPDGTTFRQYSNKINEIVVAPGATLAIGEVVTGDAGTEASVTNSGTDTAVMLDFTIPRGNTGATGATGPSGANATINGVNALTLNVAGNLSGSQSGSTYTISGANLLPKSGGTMTGNIAMGSNKITGTLSGTDYTTYRARGVALVTSAPSSISNGCIAIVYS